MPNIAFAGEGRDRLIAPDAQETSSRDLDNASLSSEDEDEQAAGGEHMRSLLKIKPSSDHEQEDHGQPSSPENNDLGGAETSDHQENKRVMQRSDAVLANLSTVHAGYRGSDSESSEAESEEEFSDLARSMWSALQKAHGAAETAEMPSRQTSKSRDKQADTGGPDKSQPSAERGEPVSGYAWVHGILLATLMSVRYFDHSMLQLWLPYFESLHRQ